MQRKYRAIVAELPLMLICLALLSMGAQAQTGPRVPERVCLAENFTSSASTCTLESTINAGHGLVIVVTVPETGATLASNALQDNRGNTYTQVESEAYSGDQFGEISMWYSSLGTALNAGDSITLSPVPALASWNFSVYDIGPVLSNAADVGVSFSNANTGLAGDINPATGVPGWWTGQTAATTGGTDMCMAAMTVNSTYSVTSYAPSPLSSYSIDNNFQALDIVDFHQLAAPLPTNPNYYGGSLMTMFREVPAGTAVQAHVITSVVDDAAASVLQCVKENTGSYSSVPHFTGNYCTGATGCTLNNVAAGDMLIISTHTGDTTPPASPATVTDSRGETFVFDLFNGAADLTTWHISPVVSPGTHTISVNNFGTSFLLVSVIEVTGQGTQNPVEAIAQDFLNSASLATVSPTSTNANDLLYAWGRSSNGSDEGDAFTAVRVTPTAEYAVAPATGIQTVTIVPPPPLPASAVGIQSLAIRPAGTSQPPSSPPHFTGNYCYANAAGCTINNVSAADMLIVSLYWALGSSSDTPQLVDSRGELIAVDRQNDYDGNESLATWHIASVANSGAHTFSITGASVQYPHMVVSEFAGQASGNPIDVAAVGATGSGTLASTSLLTASPGDLIYSWCGASNGNGTGDHFAAISIGPTAQYRIAASVPEVETATCPINGTNQWAIQEVAVKGSNAPPPSLSSIAVTPANSFLSAGASQQFTATGTYSDGSTQNLSNSVTWSSSNTAAATISTSGLATAVNTGSTTIGATLGSITGTTGLTVTAALVSIAVTPPQPSIPAGTSQQFTATGTYSDGTTQNLTDTVSWSSTATTVAVINSTGLATGLTSGSTTINAGSGTILGSTSLTVTAPVLVSLAVSPSGSSLAVGSTLQFTAIGTYSNGGTQNLTSTVTWISSNTAAATISSAGVATGVASGNTTIQASVGSISNTAALAVVANLPGLVGWWTFDEGSGTTAGDSSGSGYTATLENGVTWVPGKIGDAVSANGTNQYVYMPGINLSGTSSITVTLWTNRTYSTTGGHTLLEFSNNYNNSTTGFGIFPDDNTCKGIMAGLKGNVGYNVNCYTQPSSGVWHNLAFVFDKKQPANGEVTLYIDGVLQTPSAVNSSTTNSNAFGNNPLYVFSRGGTQEFGAGELDDLRIYNRALAASEIQQVYNFGNGGVSLVSLAVTPANSTITPSGKQQFTATGTYSNGTTQNLTSSVTWSSSSAAVATISSSGLASAAGLGATTIQATWGTVSGSTNLTVSTAPLASISVTPANPSIANTTSQQFTATGTYGDGTTQNLTSLVTWSSTNTNVANVSASGLATGVGVGTTTIGATYASMSGSTGLTVTSAVLVSLSVTPANPSITEGATQQFTGTGTFSDGTTQNLTNSVTWSSTNTAVVTINAAGLASGVADGSTTIGATLGSVAGSTSLTVTGSFPWIQYDTWVNFEQCTAGAAPTAACLASSTHGTAGSWSVSSMNNLVTVQTAAEDPSNALDGDTGKVGLAYNVANGATGYIQWNLPASETALSLGMWYKTGQPAAWTEGPHFITLYNYSFGTMLRLSDERSSANNARQIRVSPLDNAVAGIADNTWYWVTMKWIQSGAGTFSVYDTAFNLVGTVNFTDPFGVSVQSLQIGNSSGTPPETGSANYMDDLIVDFTYPNFPLLPQP